MYNNISTPNKPLYFFEVFLSKDNFDKFTNDFFTNDDNPTFYADIKNGFIGSGSKVGDQAKRLDNLNKKKSIFRTPLN